MNGQGSLDSMSLSDLDDAAIGRLVRHAAQTIHDDTSRSGAAAWWWAGASAMAGVMSENKVDQFTQVVHGYGHNGQFYGDYRVTIEKLDVKDDSFDAEKGTSLNTDSKTFGSVFLAKVLRGIRSSDRQLLTQGFPVFDSVFPIAIQFLFRRLRLLGIVPVFYAGDGLAMATGASTQGNTPLKALASLESDLREQIGLSAGSTRGVLDGVAGNLVDVDRLPEQVAIPLATSIMQGDVQAFFAGLDNEKFDDL